MKFKIKFLKNATERADADNLGIAVPEPEFEDGLVTVNMDHVIRYNENDEGGVVLWYDSENSINVDADISDIEKVLGPFNVKPCKN